MILGQRLRHSNFTIGNKKTFSNSLGNRVGPLQDKGQLMFHTQQHQPRKSLLERHN
jgi:hypothetical protein